MSIEHCALDRGRYEQLAEKHAGLKQSQCRNFMRIYQEFGQNCSRLQFSNHVLIALTRTPGPQAALEEAGARKERGRDVAIQHKHMLAILDSGRWDETPEPEVEP